MSSKTAQTLRSDIIAHWTGGKDIEADYKNPAKPEYYRNCETRRVRYLERLKGTLLGSSESGGQPGLWMKVKPITLYVKPNLRSVAKWPFTCFTEAKPEQSAKHMEHYGYLGFGFSREFVLRHYGAPVLYVPGRKEMPMVSYDDTIISRHIIKTILLSDFLAKRTLEVKSRGSTYEKVLPRKGNPVHFEEFIEACHLQDYLQNLQSNAYTQKEDKDWRLFAAIRGSIITFSVFLKAMSEDDSSHPFELLDEFEWRIPYINGKRCFEATGLTDPPHVIPFGLSDLRILVVPDAEVRKLALKDEDILEWFDKNVDKIKTAKEYMSKP